MYIYKGALKTVKEYLFPVFCLACEREGSWVCSECFETIEVQSQLFCPLCHEKTERGNICGKCVERSEISFLTSHVAATIYKESDLIGEIIHTLKYDFADDVMILIAQLVEKWGRGETYSLPNVDMIIPVPLHKKRYAERGFNQATLLARELKHIVHAPVKTKRLIRAKNTPHQARLDREGRLKNVHNAFNVRFQEKLKGKRVLLVDDVYTTGATMQACAKALLDAGAKDVYGWTLARG